MSRAAGIAFLLIVTMLLASAILTPSASAYGRTFQNPGGASPTNVLSDSGSIYLPLMQGSSASSNPPATPQSSLPTLLASYVIQPYPQYAAARYTPRSFTASPYDNWDVLRLPGNAINDGINTTMSDPNWLTLQLNRPATVAIVWRGQMAPPAWLASWTPAEQVTIDGASYPSYRKSFPAGPVTLGGVNDPGATTSQPTYLVLFAEADGTPTPPPGVPDGKEMPQPNQPCPAWVHDQYVTTGPDGQLYPTWHPQIDPVYWCYFQHDHGSDPALFLPNYKPAYGYTATAMGDAEPHVGFKSYVFDDGQGHQWLITHHFGTGSVKRACVRFHTVDVAVADKSSGELLADIHLMGDFGKSVVNKTGEPLTPSSCPDQAAAPTAEGSHGLRMIPVATRDSVGYEPWRLGDSANILGFKSAGLTFNTPQGAVICNDVTCDEPVATGSSGVFRFLSFATGLGFTAGDHTGEFYTDVYGKTLLSVGQEGAVRQYIKPGINISLTRATDDEELYPSDPWHVLYVVAQTAPIDRDMNLEGALQTPN